MRRLTMHLQQLIMARNMDKLISKVKKDLDKGEKDTKVLKKADKKADAKMKKCDMKMKKKKYVKNNLILI